MEEKLIYCQACLSSDRKLFPLKNVKELLKRTCLWQLVTVQGGVCFECKHVIKKFAIFKKQIQQAQDILINLKVQNATTFSKLEKITTDTKYTFIYSTTSQNSETNKETETKQEEVYIEEEKCMNNQEFCSEQEIKIKNEFHEALNTKHSDQELNEDLIEIKPHAVNIVKQKKVNDNLKREACNAKNSIQVYLNEEFVEVKPTNDIYIEIDNAKQKKAQSKFINKEYNTEDFDQAYSDSLVAMEIEKKNDKNQLEIEFNISDQEYYSDQEDEIKEQEKVKSKLKKELYNSNDSSQEYSDQEEEIKKQKRVKSKFKKDKDSENLLEKFTTVIFTEEEMVKNREEKSKQPNFRKIPYKCDSCVLGFLRKDTYDFHMEKRHDEKIGPVTCPVCQIRFACEKQMQRHKLKHYMCYRCKLCKYETLEMWSAYSHARGKHSGDRLESIHCGYCDYVAKAPDELSHHVTSEHSVYCNECGAKFKALNTLKSHIRRVHRVKREFVCDLCTKTFKTKSRLESHMVNHNETIARRLAYCALCNIQYKNIYIYRNHLRTSANHAEQSYQCAECNKQFASKYYWKKHYNFYHLRKSQFHCDICNKLFISDWRLKCHRQTQHGSSRSRDHHCSQCGKQFFTLSTLKGHQLTHSEQRSFMCEDCGDTFKQRSALYTHCKLVHMGLKRRKKVA